MAIVDRYAEQARREFFHDVASGTGFLVNEPLGVLGGRSLHEAWVAGDRESVARWVGEADDRAEAVAERHRNDPGHMALLRRLSDELRVQKDEQTFGPDESRSA